MKKSFAFTAILGVVFFGVILSSCSKRDPAADLVDRINRSPLGIKIVPKPGQTVVQAASNGRCLITFKGAGVIYDYSAMGEMMGRPLKLGTVPIEVAEMTFLYGPREKYLEWVSCRGMRFAMDSAQMEKLQPGKGFGKGSVLEMRVEKADFQNYVLSPLLTYEGKDLWELLRKIIATSRQQVRYALGGVSYDFQVPLSADAGMAFRIKVERVEFVQRALSDLVISLYAKNPQTPDFAALLKQGSTLFDGDATASGFSLSIKVGEREYGAFSLDQGVSSFALKPDDAKAAFAFRGRMEWKGMKTVVPGSPLLEKLICLDESALEVSFESMGPGFAQTFFELFVQAMALNAGSDQGRAEQEQQKMMAAVMKLGGELSKSKPLLKATWSPFKHPLFEGSGEMTVQFPGLGWPCGKATFKVSKFNEALKKIRGLNLIPAKEFPKVERELRKVLVVDKNGDAAVTLELRSGQPGKYFLNGKAVPFGGRGDKEDK